MLSDWAKYEGSTRFSWVCWCCMTLSGCPILLPVVLVAQSAALVESHRTSEQGVYSVEESMYGLARFCWWYMACWISKIKQRHSRRCRDSVSTQSNQLLCMSWDLVRVLKWWDRTLEVLVVVGVVLVSEVGEGFESCYRLINLSKMT